jgi:hypothetical protein
LRCVDGLLRVFFALRQLVPTNPESMGSSTRPSGIFQRYFGGIRIDWETLVCYQPMKWDDFAVKRPPDSWT